MGSWGGAQIVTHLIYSLLPVGVIHHMGENLVVRRVDRWGRGASVFQVTLVC